VIVNLCVNARDAMPTGGSLVLETANIHITVPPEGPEAVIPPGRYVLLTVTDTGIGMDPVTQHHLFEPFFTTKEPGKGTGLGLATVYGIVKQSGGFIFVDSAPGAGTRFRIYLPQVEGESAQPAAVPVALNNQTGRGTILLVEDDESVRRLGRRILEGAGYRILEAADGAEALAVAEAWQGDFDLVITDVIMPAMSGQVLSAQLRDRSPNLRILYVSGYTDDAILQHGQLLPNTGFLQKPFTPSSLIQRVQHALTM
jgi:CheY-like chemotaxis protein